MSMRKVIIKVPDPKYVCSSCRLPVDDPKQAECGHIYCRSCVEELTGLGSVRGRCKIPGCNEIITLQKDSPATAIAVRCINVHSGCEWQGTILQDHLLECDYEMIPCVHDWQGCTTKILRKDLAPHLDTECDFRPENCPACDDTFNHIDLTAHRGECEYEKIPCIHKDCGERIPRKDLSKHLTDTCAFRSAVCQWCKESRPFKDIAKHQESCPMAPARCKWCGKKGLTRSQLQDHQHPQTGDCPNMKLPCHFEPTGCREKKRKQEGRYAKTLGTVVDTVLQLASNMERTPAQDEESRLDMHQDSKTTQRKKKKLAIKMFREDIALAEQDLRFQVLELPNYGTLIWKIAGFSRKRHDAITGKTVSFYSPCFFTSRTGYKMCARIYLNGDGMGKGTHVSLFFVVMRGHYDGLLRWPFRQKVTFMLLDHKNRDHLTDAFRPDPTSSSFQRPTSDMNIASGCPLFVPLSQLDSSSHAYVRDDTMYIKVVVDTSDLP
ncbi:TNF receptor-associated factor 3-like isoform X2 [Branchiostoma floridae x Branchiostoma japonicum]